MDAEKIRQAAEFYNRRAIAEGWKTRADPTLAFQRGELANLFALWQQKAKDGLPRRDAFDARSLKAVLPRMCIAERLADGGWRWRLYGTGLTVMMGEYTGKRLDEVLPPEHVTRWGFTYDCVLDTPAPMRFQSNFQLSRLEHLSGETFILPLANEAGKANLVMAVAYVRMREEDDKFDNQMRDTRG